MTRRKQENRNNFPCPVCEHGSYVTDSRHVASFGRTRRRRKCKRCGEAFTTVEISVEEFDALKSESRRLEELKALLGRRLDGEAETV